MFYRAYVGIILAYSLLTTSKFFGASWNQTSLFEAPKKVASYASVGLSRQTPRTVGIPVAWTQFC